MKRNEKNSNTDGDGEEEKGKIEFFQLQKAN